MNVLTLKHSRKQRRERAIRADNDARLERACKAVNLTPVDASAPAQIAALEAYIERLQSIHADMQATYAGVLGPRGLSMLDAEIRRALEQIVKLEIEQARPSGAA